MDEAVNIQTAAKMLGVDPMTVRRMIAGGSIAAFDISSAGGRAHWRLQTSEIKRFMEQHAAVQHHEVSESESTS